MEIALVLVAVFAVLVAVMAVVWAVKRPAPGASGQPTVPLFDGTVLAQQIGAEVKAQMADVKSQIGEAATTALQANNDQFLTLAAERMGAVHEKTKGLLDPFQLQMGQLQKTVGDLRSAHEKNKGSVDSMAGQLGRQITELGASTARYAPLGSRTRTSGRMPTPSWFTPEDCSS